MRTGNRVISNWQSLRIRYAPLHTPTRPASPEHTTDNIYIIKQHTHTHTTQVAISADPEDETGLLLRCYSARSTAYLSLGRLAEAVEDAQAIMDLKYGQDSTIVQIGELVAKDRFGISTSCIYYHVLQNKCVFSMAFRSCG
jgi:hypothetical protein